MLGAGGDGGGRGLDYYSYNKIDNLFKIYGKTTSIDQRTHYATIFVKKRKQFAKSPDNM